MKDKIKRDKLIRDYMDLDKVEMKKRVDKALKMIVDQLSVISAEEKIIIDYVKSVLDERCVKYTYDASNFKTIYISRVNDNKPFSMKNFTNILFKVFYRKCFFDVIELLYAEICCF